MNTEKGKKVFIGDCPWEEGGQEVMISFSQG